MANVLSDINNYLSGGQLQQGSSDYSNAVKQLAANTPPQLTQLIPALHLQVLQGTMSPADAQAAIQQASVANGIQSDPTTASAQLQALNQLQTISQNGGLTQADKSQINQIEQSVGQQNKSRQSAVMQQAQMQGVGGSGADLAARLSGAQSANVAASDASNSVAQDAQQRQLQALAQSGQLATTMNQNDFNNQLSKANAQNSINQFNAGNQTAVSNANANRATQANQQNFQTANQVAQNNTATQNQQALLPLNTAVTQAGLNNQYATNLAGAEQNAGKATIDQGNTQNKNSTNDINTIGNVISSAGGDNGWVSGLGKAASAIGGWFSDPKMKEDKKDLTDDDIDELLEKLSGKSYKYKKGSPGDDGGQKHVGIMTVDLAKTPLKGNVAHTDKGDVIMNDDDMNGAILAALSHMHEKIKDLT